MKKLILLFLLIAVNVWGFKADTIEVGHYDVNENSLLGYSGSATAITGTANSGTGIAANTATGSAGIFQRSGDGANSLLYLNSYGADTGEILLIRNEGTGDSLVIHDGTSNRFDITKIGVIEWWTAPYGAVDVNLYRSAADTLKTDDTFQAATLTDGTLSINGGNVTGGGTSSWNGVGTWPSGGIKLYDNVKALFGTGSDGEIFTSALDNVWLKNVTSGGTNLTGFDDSGGSSETVLTDTSEDFTALGVIVGDFVRNTTDGSRGYITVVGTTTITVSDLIGGTNNTFSNGNAYVIEAGNLYITNEAQDKSIIFKFNNAGVDTEIMRITNNNGILGEPRVSIGGDTGPAAILSIFSNSNNNTFNAERDGNLNLFNMTNYATGNFRGNAFTGVRANNTKASPTAVQAGDRLFTMGGSGYDGVTFGNANIQMRLLADETFTDSGGTNAHGTRIEWYVTPSGGGTTLVKSLVLENDGDLSAVVDGTTLTLGTTNTVTISHDSADSGHLDLTAGTSIDLQDKLIVEADGDTYWVGDGTGLIYGHMYIPGATNVITVSLDNANPGEVKDDGTVSANDGWSTGELNEVVFAPSDLHYVTVPKIGKYKVIWSLAAHTGIGGGTVAHAGVMVNNSAIRDIGESHATVSNSTNVLDLNGVTVVDITSLAGNSAEISLWIADDNSTDIVVEHGNMFIEQVGGT